MYLKKLGMIGFKSFADMTTVEFKPGITAIVGPNGCGKSNIVDAILWVLGEQSTKTLRSDKMEDVIFNGTEARRPLNLSEVTLTVGDVSDEVDNRFGNFQEIGISRRLFRSGESEYLINKIPSRLKDVRDLLIDTGAGHKGHTIIEQGKVDQLLNSSPNDRRELIEETAGISKYKIRKAEAQRKLEATQTNLLRVTDIISEVRRQMNALERQVKKTQTYKKLQDEARSLDLLLLLIDYRTHNSSLRDLVGRLNGFRTELSARMADLSRAQAELQEVKTSLLRKESDLSALKQTSHETQILIQRQENRIELLRGQIQSWGEQKDRLAAEQVQLGDSILQSERAEQETGEQIEAGSGQLSRLRGSLTEKESLFNAAEEESSRHESTLNSLKTRQFELMADMTQIKNEAAGLESRKKELARIQEKGRLELNATRIKNDQCSQSLAGEKTRADEMKETLERLNREQNRLSEDLGTKQADSDARGERILQKREELTLIQARLASLEENEKNMTLSLAGVHSLLKEQPEVQSRLHGIVADLLVVSAEHEAAIEAVLGEQLQGMLTEDHGTTREIVELLKTGKNGRGLFMPRETRPARFSSQFPSSDTPGVIGPLLKLAQIRPGFEAVAESLLGGVLLVRDLDTALTLWRSEKIDFSVVTLDGEFLEPTGLLWGGVKSDSDQGLLKTRREIQKVQAAAQSMGTALEEEESERNRLNREIEEIKSIQTGLSEKRGLADEALVAQLQKIAVLEKEYTGLEERIGFLSEEDRQEAAEIEAVEIKITETARRLEEQHQVQARLESELRDKEEQHRAVLEKKEELQGKMTQLKVEVTSLAERQDSLGKEKVRLQEEQNSLKTLRTQKSEEAVSIESRVQGAHEDIRSTETEVQTLSSRLTEMQQDLSVKTEDYTNHLDRVKRLENLESEGRAEVSRLEKLVSEQEVRQTELKLRLEHLTEQADTLHKTDLSAAAAEPPAGELTPEEREQKETRLAELKRKLEQMGPVNLAAIEEQKELEERFRFLTEQETDLRQSIEDLNTAITKINKTTREMFLSAYTALRAKFKEVFKEFFEGGEADLILLDEQHPLDSGIEILAQPPGKKLKGITLLSGGEKALTAISLLFASFLIHPSPFCILDEIDAPLDEENIRRFLRVLRRMTDHSQFLIITHNKRTMEEADLLYGVTMEEPGVTKLVSVNMESSSENGHGRPPIQSVRPETSPTATP